MPQKTVHIQWNIFAEKKTMLCHSWNEFELWNFTINARNSTRHTNKNPFPCIVDISSCWVITKFYWYFFGGNNIPQWKPHWAIHVSHGWHMVNTPKCGGGAQWIRLFSKSGMTNFEGNFLEIHWSEKNLDFFHDICFTRN